MKFLDLEMMEVWHNSPGKEAEPPPVKVAKLIESVLIVQWSLEVKLPTIWTDEKAEVGRVREEKSRREKIREEKEKEEKKMQVPEKVAKSRNTVFPMICG